ncbi:hypothetical protein DL771_006918 [Monosporascus sp. 5C6A]|nr:hypothetical protein DL771_006918 [Monosporascus sp. 5C6A]
MPSLKDLPNELLIFVISHLPVHTKKAFRLTCRAYEPIPLPFLFRRIRLSRLREDKDAFERVAAHPQLRVHVRELVWYELELEAWRVPWTGDVAGDDYNFMRRLMRAATSDCELFWIPIHASNSSRLYFQQHFFELLAQIPGLRTVASRPIPADRIILYKGRPLPADLWTLSLEPNISGGNQGFFTYLVPAMRRPQSNIANLQLAEERLSRSGLFDRRYGAPDADAFRSLASIDLCLNDLLWDHDGQKRSWALPRCLRGAQELRHLKLHIKVSPFRDEQLHSFLNEVFGEAFWPSLTSLHLVDIPGVCRDSIARCLERHATTLHSLNFEECMVNWGDIRKLKSLHLRLGSIKITQPYYYDRILGQQQLLSYVNNVTPLYNAETSDIPQLDESDGAVVVTEKGGMSKVEWTISDRDDDYDGCVDYEFPLSEGDDEEGEPEEGNEGEGNAENKKEDEEDEVDEGEDDQEGL